MLYARWHARRTLGALAARVRLYQETGALASYLAAIAPTGCSHARLRAAVLVEEPHQRARAATALAALTRLAARRKWQVDRVPTPELSAPDLPAWRDGRRILIDERVHDTAAAQALATLLMEEALGRPGSAAPEGMTVDVVARLTAHVLQGRLGLANPNTAQVLCFMGIEPAAIVAAAGTVAPVVVDALRDARPRAGDRPLRVRVRSLLCPRVAAWGDGRRL